jgi:hypothetical protein
VLERDDLIRVEGKTIVLRDLAGLRAASEA